MSDVEDNISEASDTSHIPEEAAQEKRRGGKKRQESSMESSQITQNMHTLRRNRPTNSQVAPPST